MTRRCTAADLVIQELARSERALLEENRGLRAFRQAGSKRIESLESDVESASFSLREAVRALGVVTAERNAYRSRASRRSEVSRRQGRTSPGASEESA